MDNSKLDRFVEGLQKKIIDDAKEKYSQKVVDEWLNPRNFGRIDNPTSHAIFKGPCGDTMEFYLRINDGRIIDVSFMTDGCGPTIACGSMLTKLIRDKNVEDASKIDAKELASALDGLPEENLHCATLAITTLQKALNKIGRKL